MSVLFSVGRDLLHLNKLGIKFSSPLSTGQNSEQAKQEQGTDLNASFESSLLGAKSGNLASISEEGLEDVDFQVIK